MRSPDAAPGAHTTLAVIAASVALIPAECKRVAMMARDGMARAIRPIHTPFDGDTVFALAHGRALPEAGLSQLGLARAAALARIGSAAADGLARAIARGVHHASSRSLNRRIL
jgi:L-aminopeptidase/D-esterase-like protein